MIAKLTFNDGTVAELNDEAVWQHADADVELMLNAVYGPAEWSLFPLGVEPAMQAAHDTGAKLELAQPLQEASSNIF